MIRLEWREAEPEDYGQWKDLYRDGIGGFNFEFLCFDMEDEWDTWDEGVALEEFKQSWKEQTGKDFKV